MRAILPSESAPAAAPRPASQQPLFVVLNPGSGRHEAEQARAVLAEAFARAGRTHTFVPVDHEGPAAACRRAARQAKQEGGVLVVAGGDGTVSAAAQAAHDAGCPLGVLPQGTFNFFGREHGLPQDVEQGVQVLLNGTPQPVRVGLVNERLFLVNASMGLYPQLLQDRETFKQRLGRRRWVAMLSGLRTVLGWSGKLTLEIEQDGAIRRLVTPTLVVGANSLQLERIGLPAQLLAQVEEGSLAALAMRPGGRWAKWRLMARSAIGRLGQSEEVESFAFRSLNVLAPHARRVKVGIDGEVQWMVPPLRFSVAPRPLMVVLPKPGQE
ncbi:MAG: diacylglycerol kinase family protein [Pseudomonadota bacterium]